MRYWQRNKNLFNLRVHYRRRQENGRKRIWTATNLHGEVEKILLKFFFKKVILFEKQRRREIFYSPVYFSKYWSQLGVVEDEALMQDVYTGSPCGWQGPTYLKPTYCHLGSG